MLEITTLLVDEVGAQPGYTEPLSFRAASRGRVGLTPSAYRRRWTLGGAARVATA